MAAFVLVAVPLPALAQASLAGVVRDQDGYAVARAQVRLASHSGGSLAETTTDGDGTFFFAAVPAGAELVVNCSYCRTRHVPLDGASDRVIAVERSAVLRDRGLTADDLRVLPYDRLSDDAALLPFAVENGAAVSDRGLARGRGTLVVDGIPGYRALDGVELSSAVPGRSATSLDELSPAAANAGDERVAGGLFGIGTFDDAVEGARIDAGADPDLELRGGNAAQFSVASGGDGGVRTSGAFQAPIALPAGSLDLSGSAARDVTTGLSWEGTSIDYRRDLQVATIAGSFSAVHSIASSGPEADSVATASYQRGSFLAGVRARSSTADGFGIAGTQADARAFVQSNWSGPAGSAFVSLAIARASNVVSGAGTNLDMLLPTIALTGNASSHVSANASLVNALVAPPFVVVDNSPLGSYAIDTTHLLEGSVAYDDGTALRLAATVFRETIAGSQPSVLGGSGIAATWQIAPGLALRTWTLVSKQSVTTTVSETYGGSPVVEEYALQTTGVDNDRNLVWLTLGRTWRADIIAHGGALDGDLLVPIGRHLALVAGTYRSGTSRTSSIGLSAR